MNEITCDINIDCKDEEYLNKLSNDLKDIASPFVEARLKEKGFVTDNEVAFIINSIFGYEALPLSHIGDIYGFTENPFKSGFFEDRKKRRS